MPTYPILWYSLKSGVTGEEDYYHKQGALLAIELEMKASIQKYLVNNDYNCWYSAFMKWISSTDPSMTECHADKIAGLSLDKVSQNTSYYDPQSKENMFYNCLYYFVKQVPKGALFDGKNGLKWKEINLPIENSQTTKNTTIIRRLKATMLCQVKFYFANTEEVMEGMIRIINKYRHGFKTLFFFGGVNGITHYALEDLSSGMFKSMLYASLAVYACVLLLTADVWTSTLIFLCVILSMVDVAGFLKYWGEDLEFTLAVNLILAIGLIVDYSVHIGHSFLKYKGTRDERIEAVLLSIGPAVFHGGFSTLLSFLVLAGATSAAFVNFFKIFMLVVSFGLFHGLLFLPAVLSLVGSPPYKNVTLQAVDTIHNVMNTQRIPIERRKVTILVPIILSPSAQVTQDNCRSHKDDCDSDATPPPPYTPTDNNLDVGLEASVVSDNPSSNQSEKKDMETEVAGQRASVEIGVQADVVDDDICISASLHPQSDNDQNQQAPPMSKMSKKKKVVSRHRRIKSTSNISKNVASAMNVKANDVQAKSLSPSLETNKKLNLIPRPILRNPVHSWSPHSDRDIIIPRTSPIYRKSNSYDNEKLGWVEETVSPYKEYSLPTVSQHGQADISSRLTESKLEKPVDKLDYRYADMQQSSLTADLMQSPPPAHDHVRNINYRNNIFSAVNHDGEVSGKEVLDLSLPSNKPRITIQDGVLDLSVKRNSLDEDIYVKKQILESSVLHDVICTKSESYENVSDVLEELKKSPEEKCQRLDDDEKNIVSQNKRKAPQPPLRNGSFNDSALGISTPSPSSSPSPSPPSSPTKEILK